MRYRLIALVVIVLAGAGFFIMSRSSDEPVARTDDETSVAQTQPTQEAPAESEERTSIRIAAMGDMLPHDTVNLRAQDPNDPAQVDYRQFLRDIEPALAGSDIVFCNQEAPSAGIDYGITGYPSFNAPTGFARDLNGFGCNVINLANNHIADKGQAPIAATLSVWDSLDALAVSGANNSFEEQNTVSYFEVAGRTFAFIAFTDLSNNTAVDAFSVNMFSTDLVTRLASEASANADYVIASAHWGVEDSEVVSDSQRSWATLLAENGVDLIIGTGPHVLQPVEKIGETVVWYSIGNFLSTQLTIEQLTGGIAFIDIPLDGGEPTLSFQPTYMSYTWTAEQAAAEDFLARDNLNVYSLEDAEEAITNSLFNTTVSEQLERITSLLNQSTQVEIVSVN